MLFTQSLFLFYFLPAALIAHRIALGTTSQVNTIASRFLLIGATLVFYGAKQPFWLLPLFSTILISFLGARAIQKTRERTRRLILLYFALILQISLWVIFKYVDIWQVFFNISGSTIGHPPGISFYFLESISFLVDVFRGGIVEPIKLSSVFQFIVMFPRFIAGPIVRYSTIRTQSALYSGMNVDAGLFVFIYGFFLKVCLADSFALFTNYATIVAHGTTFVETWIGVIAFAMQVYFDFSGYSLMAIGLGKCFGFQFPTNFDRPFHASSLHDYWARWHMTLGAWLKDYVFHPLGVSLSRLNESLIYVALFLTMVLCGLWHGIGANFILWGAWHGLFLCLERYFRWETRFPLFLSKLVTLLIVFFGVGIYKAENLSEVTEILHHLVNPTFGWKVNFEAILSYRVSAIFAVYGLFHCIFVERFISTYKIEKGTQVSLVQSILGTLLFVVSLVWVLSDNYVPFLYFQF